MNDKNIKPVELTDEQLDQVSGGTSMFVSQTVIPSQNSPTRLSTASNIKNVDSDGEQARLMGISQSLNKRPRPRN